LSSGFAMATPQLRSNGDRNKWYICRTNARGSIVYGVMFTRSIGDADATASLGVIPQPEMLEEKLTEDDKYLVLATDGVWDVMSNTDVAELVSRYPEAQEAAFQIVQECVP